MTAWIVDVAEGEFEREVLARSEQVPVVVDFWAPWCGPCRTLGPILERLAAEHAGEFVLARVNIDEAPGLAQAFQVRSIPAVQAVRDRGLLAGFEGAQPESVVRRFLASILPAEADRAARSGAEAAAAGPAAAPVALFEAPLALEARHPQALLGLARLRADADDPEAALSLLERVRPGTAASAEADRLAAALRTRAAAGEGEEDDLRRRIEATPGDLAARLALGRLLAAQARHAEALDCLLESVRREPGYAEGAARLAMLDVFAVLGGEHLLTQEYRAALARTLFR